MNHDHDHPDVHKTAGGSRYGAEDRLHRGTMALSIRTSPAAEHGGDHQHQSTPTFFAMLIARALNAVLTASARIVRHSLTWRMRAAPVALQQERANQLDLLASSGVMLARTAVATSHQERPSLAPAIRHLATALAEISRNPGGRATRQRAADRALDLASWLIRMGPPYRRSTRWLPLAPPFG
jgi:hypothetical protein